MGFDYGSFLKVIVRSLLSEVTFLAKKIVSQC